ncbi:MAG: branched-chain amino acid ABC transporter permease [Actinomycetota bacterium]|nr:branched-chain amino acid ABC transporter permease [Actinomycetota bacterium]
MTRAWQAAAIAVVLLVPAFGSPVFVLHATEIFVFMVAFAGLHVLTGRLGLISIGHGAFMGIGALASAHAVLDLGLPYLVTPLASAIAAAAFGALIAVPSLRLPGAYLALLTVAMAMALPILMIRIDGPLGVRIGEDLLPPTWTGLDEYQEEIWQYGLVVVGAAMVLGLASLILNGRFGRSLIAVRDEPIAAAAFGINVARTQVLGVAFACGLAGFAGGLLVFATPYVAGDRYTFELSLFMYALTIGFGAQRLWMSIPAALVLIMLPQLLIRFGWAPYQSVVYGLLLLVATRLAGSGEFVEVLRRRLKGASRPTSGSDLTEPDIVLLEV